ncbi:hypothetical protein [Acidianus sp. HS-5]|nr:hypothetical protein [Acidianus sp. HS-5]
MVKPKNSSVELKELGMILDSKLYGLSKTVNNGIMVYSKRRTKGV